MVFISRGADVPLQGVGTVDGGRRHHRQRWRDHRATAEGDGSEGEDVQISRFLSR